tara:strand:- start:642 stop:824 length:183 start_codon:yes stop_codon:yes gene_type:complete
MKDVTKLFKKIVAIQQERNDMLKDSIYAEFALSDEAVIAEAHSVFDKEFAKSIQEEVAKL